MLHRLAASTVAALFAIVKNEDVAPHARVSAASKILDMAYRSAELVDVQAEIDALKEQLGVEV